MGEDWETDVKAQCQLSLGEGVSGLQPEKQKNEQQTLERPESQQQTDEEELQSLYATHYQILGPFLHQALLSKVQHPQTSSSYVPSPKGQTFPGLISSGPTSVGYDLPWFHFPCSDFSIPGFQEIPLLRSVS